MTYDADGELLDHFLSSDVLPSDGAAVSKCRSRSRCSLVIGTPMNSVF
jgi:hypothetical protein